jgi:hypothetical protein
MLTEFKLFENQKNYPLYSILNNEDNDLFFVLNNLNYITLLRFGVIDYDHNIVCDDISYIEHISYENIDMYYLFDRFEKNNAKSFLEKYSILIDELIERNIAKAFLEIKEFKKYKITRKFNL